LQSIEPRYFQFVLFLAYILLNPFFVERLMN